MNSEVSASPRTIGTALWALALEGDGAALETLAGRYWYPAYVWLRMIGNDKSDTAIHILSFFSRLQSVVPPRTDEFSAGRLRDFLLARLKEFAALGCPSSEGVPTFMIDVATAERRFGQEPARAEDELFARRWSLTVLEQTLAALQEEYEQQGKLELYVALKPFLGFNKTDETGYSDAAYAAGMSASAFHLAAYNFRIRYRETLREVVRDTVRSSEDVDSELTVLLVGAS